LSRAYPPNERKPRQQAQRRCLGGNHKHSVGGVEKHRETNYIGSIAPSTDRSQQLGSTPARGRFSTNGALDPKRSLVQTWSWF
jgi:hypothetical protein